MLNNNATYVMPVKHVLNLHAQFRPASLLCAYSCLAGSIHFQTKACHHDHHPPAKGITFCFPASPHSSSSLQAPQGLTVIGCDSRGSPVPPAADACADSYLNAAENEQPNGTIHRKEPEGLRPATPRRGTEEETCRIPA